MAVITYEGFENYSSFNDVKSFVGLDNYQVATIISSNDGTVTPRNSGSCLKLVSSATGGVEYYPKAMIQTPDGTGHKEAVVGFAWYGRKPASGSWGNFTPIAAFCGADGKPHFFIGVNSSLQVQVRRWTTGVNVYTGVTSGSIIAGSNVTLTTNTSEYAWNTSATSSYVALNGYKCSNTFYNYYISALVSNNGCLGPDGRSEWMTRASLTSNQSAIDITNKFILLGSTQSTFIENDWNYIEIKFVNENNSTTGTLNQGSIKLKLNRNSSDPYLDIDAINIRTSTQSASHLCSKIAFGVFWGHNAGATASAASLGWTTYIDDFYWLDTTGPTNNDFLGRISCKKFNYNTVNNYTMTNPSNSGNALNNVSEVFSGKNFINSATTKTTTSTTSTSIDLISSTISSESLTAKHVRQYAYGYRTDTNADLFIGASYSGNNTSLNSAALSTNLATPSLAYRDYSQAPDGTNWTNSKIANTTFKHTANNA
jgi:hypothetical protein